MSDAPKPTDILSGLELYLDEIGAGDAARARKKLTDLIVPRIDRVRLFRDQDGERALWREVTVPIRPSAASRSLSGLGFVDDPDLTIALNLREDGTVGFEVKSAPTLEGEDLAALAASAETPDPPSDAAIAAYEAEGFLSAQDVADRLNVHKATITRKIRRGDVLAWQGIKRDWLIPREQFHNGRVIRGVSETIAIFDGDHHEAWRFLTARLYYGAPAPRPLDRLKALRTQDQAGLDASLADFAAAREGFELGDHA